MLGIENDPKLIAIRQENPLNNIAIPQMEMHDLDERIGQFYTPVDPESPEIHPLLTIRDDARQDNSNAHRSFKLTALQTHFQASIHSRDNQSPEVSRSSGSPTGTRRSRSPRRNPQGSQYSRESVENRDDFDEESMSTDSEYEFHIEDLLADSMSPGLRMRTDYDMPQLRDQANNFECLENIISAIVNGCNFGRLCL